VSIHNHERTLALAGIVQACGLVNQIARGRWVDYKIVNTCVNSIFVMEPQDILNVYGGQINNLQFGLRRLTTFFPKPDKQHDGELANYLFGTILLSRLLQQDKIRLQKLSTAIAETQRHYLVNTSTAQQHEELLAKLAQIYTEYISTFKRRIHIVGSREILQQQSEINTIRTLLLAAIRAAILWHQVGGRLWHLWWKRQKLVEIAHELIENA
jgi:high frequency lysogenization protein